MTRRERNIKIEQNYTACTPERFIFIAISSLIGDSDEIDIDWDDLAEVTNIDDYSIIEEYLDEMYEVGLLDVLDYEENILG